MGRPFDFRQNLVLAVALLAWSSLLRPAMAGAEGTVKFSYDTGGSIQSSAAIGDDNVIYVASNDDLVYAFNPDGTVQWTYDVGGNVLLPLAVGADGTIYVPDNVDGLIIALNPDGTLKWTFDSELDSGVTGAIAIASDGTIYAPIGGATLQTLFAINPDGTEFWNYKGASTSIRGVAIGPEGVIAFTDSNGGVYLLNSLGQLQWNVDNTNGIISPPTFGEDGTVLYGSNSEYAALNLADGSLKWEIPMNTRAPASTGVDGTIYVPLAVTAGNGGIAAVNPADGSVLWTYQAGDRVTTAPTIGVDNTIYFGSNADQLVAINPDGTLKWSYNVGGDVVSNPVLAPNGTLYFGSNDSFFYALNTSSLGLAPSSWPTGQRDVRNTGRFGSETARRLFFAPHSFDLVQLGLGYTVLTMRHAEYALAGPAGLGTTAEFRVDVRDRDGSLLFSIEDSVDPGETKDIILSQDGNPMYQGSVVVDSAIADGLVLAPFLTWVLDLGFNAPLRIGAFFSDATDAAQVHHFPAEASETNGLGIGVQNIGDDAISCTLDFLNEDGTAAGQEMLDLEPLGSFVGFFNDSVAEGFKGSATFTCDAPVIAVAVNQDSANGSFPTDRVTWKGLN